MSIEEEIRKIVNEELDRRQKHDNLRELVAEGKISTNDARKQMGYPILDEEWADNSIAMPEPEVPWKERHDRPSGWYHVCENSGGVPADILLPIRAECSNCGAYLADDGNVKKSPYRKTHVSKTPYGDAVVTTVPTSRCRWCNEPIALEVNPKAPDDFWWHLRTSLQFCEGFKRFAEPKEESNDKP